MVTATVDLRAAFLGARYQELRMSCLAFACSSAHEHQKKAKDYLSVEYLYYHAIDRSPARNPDLGATMSEMADALTQHGQPLEAEWPYEPKQLYGNLWSPPKIAGSVYKAAMQRTALSFADICKRLDQGEPIVLGLIITDSFYKPAAGIVMKVQNDIERGGHAVLAVGHGASQPGQNYVLIRNSWGDTWGDGGHAWIPEGYVTSQLRESAFLI